MLPAGLFAISYRQRWKKLSVARNFTWSNRNNPRKPSNHLRGTRLEQKGGKHRRAGYARHLDVYRFFCDLLRHVRASAESDRKRTRNAIERGSFGSARRCRWISRQPMDGARFPASGCPHFSPRQARFLQPRRFMGGRTANALANDGGTLIAAR